MKEQSNNAYKIANT